MKKSVSVYLDVDQIKALKKIAEIYNTSISDVISRSLNQCINWEFINSSDIEEKNW